MANAQEIMYAVVGAGDFAVDKVKTISSIADRKANQKRYRDFVKRGRSISTKVKSSKHGKQIAAQAEPVKVQVEDALKTVTKAFGVNVVAWPKKRPAARSTARKTTRTRKSTAKKTTAKKAS
ncbi:MAG: hypothetical protein ACR2L3_05135 [Actinomycetota bacterium]